MYTQKQHLSYFELSKNFLSQNLEDSHYNDLVSLMQYHEWKYYVDNSPVISDTEYDVLYKKLEALENNNPLIIRDDSPTQRVSSDVEKDTKLVSHLTPMLSLDNSYNLEDLLEFDKAIHKLCQIDPQQDVEYYVEPKLDGGSIALVYENNRLVRAATRGNGVAGENILSNAKTLSSVPLSAKFSDYGIATVELRGEAVIHIDTFHKKNKEREQQGLEIFANPRNAATGGLRMKDANESRKRGLEVFIFQMAYAVDTDGNNLMVSLESHSKVIDMLKNLGFNIPKNNHDLANNINEVYKHAQAWEKEREAYDYEIDGAVIKVNDFVLQQKAGSTQHHPRWAIAFKFKAKQATTTLNDVEYQIGKTGAITPVAKVEAVHLAGVTVSSISLHNEEFIKQKDLRIGDKVIIERAGDVIPYIVKSIEELRIGKEEIIVFPSHCPFCHSELQKSEDQAAWRCENVQCTEQNLQRIIYHVSKAAMDIDGFGKSYVEKFNKLGWLSDISDVYNLDYDKISALEGFGQKSADNLKQAIDKAKQNPLHRVLNSLSIHHLGKKASKLIAQNIESAMDLKVWTVEQYVDIKDVGPVVAENVIHWFSIPENIELLERMESYGVNLSQTEADKPRSIKEGAVLLGKTILFTGSLKEMTRKQAQAMAEENGAKNISAVSSNLNILVVGEKAGSKLKKAQAIGTVQILTELEYLELVNG